MKSGESKVHSYKGVKFEWYHGKYVIQSNKDLLDLGLVNKKNLQRGHKGFKTLERLTKTIDEKKEEKKAESGFTGRMKIPAFPGRLSLTH